MKTHILVLSLIVLATFSCTNSGQNSEGTTEDAAVEGDATETNLPQEMMAREWKLISFEQEGKKRNLQEGSNITLKFAADRSFGNGGCNMYSAAYTLPAGGSISFGEVAATKKICSNMMGQEQTFFNLLKASTSYAYKDGILELDGPSHKLTFRYNAPENG